MKIDFYHIDAFEVPNYEPIWRSLRKKGVDANLIGVPGEANAAELGWFDFDRFKQYCTDRNLPFKTEINSDADIAITTQNADILREYQGIKVRLMYGPIIYPHAWGLQPHSVTPFDYVLTHGPRYAKEFSAWLNPKKLPIIGYPRYDDYFLNGFSKEVIHKKWGIKDKRPVLVFLPTWGENSGFEKFFNAILKLKSDFNILLRPHHCTLRLEPKRMQALQESGLLILENAFDLAEIYKGADIVLSDVRSGSLFEACLCNVPSVGLVIDETEKAGWLSENKIENIMSLCSDPETLKQAVHDAMTSTSQLIHRQAWINHHVSFCDGSAADIAADILIQIMSNTKASIPTTIKKKILIMLGSANMSGGTYVIFQHASYLKSQGYDVTIALVFMTKMEFLTLKDSDTCWHKAISELKFIHIDEAKDHYDIAIFTWWATLFYFDQIKSDNFIYFIQSIESRFYEKEMSFMRDLVERTYKIGLPVITEATWIKQYLSEHYQNNCLLVKNGILKSLYHHTGDCFSNKSETNLRILIEGPVDVNYKNILKTVELCKKANVGEIWLLTSSDIETYPDVDRVFSRIPIYDVPKIYRSCDVVVKLSYVEGMFGPPLEMFHCGGTAIVYDVTGHDEYIMHDENALVVKTDDESTVIDYLKLLNQDRSKLKKLKEGSMRTAESWMDWQESSHEFEKALMIHSNKPLTNLQTQTYKNRVDHYLKETIPAILWMGNQSECKLMIAHPLCQQSGFYSLSVPIENGLNKLEIILGNQYRKFKVQLVSLLKKSKSDKMLIENISPVLNLSATHMKNNNGDFDCISETSAICVSIDNAALNHDNYHYEFKMEFNPLEI